jgi:membrane-associated phospholipid phosphatase
MKLASPLFGGKEAGRLANMLSNFGGGSAIAALGVGYLAGGVGTKHVCGRAFEAAGEAMLITGSLKFLTGRMRPRQSGNDPDEFRGPGSGYGSFPSGHTSNAFALASVLAYEHPKRRWLYYGLATGVGLARLQQRAHYLSDVVAGATIGIYAGRSAVTGHTIFGRLRHVRHKLTQRGD